MLIIVSINRQALRPYLPPLCRSIDVIDSEICFFVGFIRVRVRRKSYFIRSSLYVAMETGQFFSDDQKKCALFRVLRPVHLLPDQTLPLEFFFRAGNAVGQSLGKEGPKKTPNIANCGLVLLFRAPTVVDIGKI